MSWLANISVTCFAASYLVAWLLELSRLFFRSGVRGAIMLAFATAGLAAQTFYLVERAWHGPRPPLSSSFDWCMLTAWALVIAYLYLTYQFPRSAMGLFVLPLVIGLVLAAALWADRTPIASQSATRIWGSIHGVFLLFGAVAVMVGFVSGVMYLLQAHRLKNKLAPMQRFRYPSLEWLEIVNGRMIHVSAAMVSGGFLSGVILKTIRDREFENMPWTDPVVWSSAAMVAWLVAASIFNAVYKPARTGRKVAYLTVVSFVFLAFSLMVLLLVKTEHSGRKNAEGGMGKAELDITDRPSLENSAFRRPPSAFPTGGAE